MKSKGGAAHFEMIISFIFFISFVFFLFLVLKPYDTTKLSNTVIDGMYNTLKENSQTNLTNIFLKADYSGNKDCFYIDLPDSILEYDLTKSIVTEISGQEIDSEILSGTKIEIKNQSSLKFFKIAISPIFFRRHT